MKLNREGYTLVEIIICVVLLTLIGTGATIVVVNSNNKKENNILLDNTEDFKNALNIYLETHSEVLYNLYNNVEGAVVSLELLKNEGLITDKLDINYEDNYFVLSDAVLLDNNSDGESECNGRVSIATIKSWDLNKYDSSDVIYICPKESVNSNVTNNIVNITEGNIQTNTSNILLNGYNAKGNNPNNWVEFGVNSDNSKWVTFPNDDDKDLWRILSIGESGKIKLIYNKSISGDWSISPNIDKNNCYSGASTYCKPIGAYTISSNRWYRINTDTDFGLTHLDIFKYTSSIENSAKNFIYNSIINKSWLSKEKYYGYGEHPGQAIDASLGLYIYKQDYDNYYEDYIGHLSINEYRASVNSLNETYLKKQVVGYTDYFLNENKTYFLITGSEQANLMDVSNYNKKDDGKYIYYTNLYYPVVTLNTNIKIKNYSNCNNGSIRGSKECPYELIET